MALIQDVQLFGFVINGAVENHLCAGGLGGIAELLLGFALADDVQYNLFIAA